MTYAIAQSISTELYDRLAALTAQDGTLDELALQRLKIQADKLMATEPAEAHTILGNIAALKFNDADVDRHHKAAIALCKNAWSHSNYAISLQIALRRDEAASQAAIACSLDPLNLPAARRAIRYLAVAGRIEEGMKMLGAFKARYPAEDISEAENLPAVHAILQRYGIQEEDVQACQREAFALLREKKIAPRSIIISSDEGDADESISYSICLNEPIDRVIELDEELGRRIFTSLPNLNIARFWLGFEREIPR